MANDFECQAVHNECMKHDMENNITEPDFDQGCWKYFLALCIDGEPGRDPEKSHGITSSTLALVIPLVVIAALSIGTNSMVCVVFALHRQLRLIRHYFVINLAAADIAIAAILIPLFVAQLITGNIALCRCELVLDIGCGTASILSLAMISIERYIAVVYSLQYNTIVTYQKAVCCMVFIWVYSLIVSSLAIPDLVTGDDPTDCFFMGGEYVTFITLASFVLPVGVMVAAYWKIFLVARTHARRIDSLTMPNESSASGHSKSRMKRELKGAKTLTIIMGTHFVCWCPQFVFLLVYTYCPSCWSNTSMHVVNYVIVFLHYCNSFANPLIYSGVNRQFRSAIKRVVFRRDERIEEFHTTAVTRP